MIAALVAGAFCAPAGAATVSVSGSAPNKQISVVDGPGSFGDAEESWIALSSDSGNYRLEDGFEDLIAGSGCAGDAANSVVTCSTAGVATITMSLGPGDDIVEAEVPIPVAVQGGTGDDELTGGFDAGSGPVEFHGGDGFDSLEGGPAADHLYGDDGEDDLGGGEGGDTLEGGAANDSLDGEQGDDSLDGGGGNDSLGGGLGDDSLEGGTGTDTASYANVPAGVTVGTRPNSTVLPAQVTGGAGSDTLTRVSALAGSAHNDHLTGDSGPNTMVGGKGSDVLDAAGGNDTIDAVDGSPDMVSCGTGNDDVSADQFDTLSGCENPTITQVVPPATVTPPSPSPQPLPQTATAAAKGSASLHVTRKLSVKSSKVKIKLACTTAGPCEGRVRLLSGKAVFGEARFRLAAGATNRVSLALSSKARKTLKRKGRATVKAVLLGARGDQRLETRTLSLRGRKPA